MRKFLLSASLAGLVFTAGSVCLHAIPPRAASTPAAKAQQSAPATKMITGKVTAIGNGGQSFSLEVNNGENNKETMQFVLDKGAKVQGRVTVGTPVTVEYQAMNGGQNIALTITAQG
jgi:hypothetical protein